MRQAVWLLLISTLLCSPALADVIYESATLGPTGQYGGNALTSSQFFGVRFEITEPVQVTEVGGHLSGWNGSLFAAIVSLPGGAGTLPTGSPFDSSVEAYTTFTASSASQDYRAPLSVYLDPGWYALVFGSGQFGATGTGAMPGNNDPLPEASYIRWDGSQWRSYSTDLRLRFVVEGDLVTPEPGSLALLSAGALGIAALLRRRRNLAAA